MPESAESVEHQVDVVGREFPAFGEHVCFFRQDVEIEADAVPGDDGVTPPDLGCQIFDQSMVTGPGAVGLSSLLGAVEGCRGSAGRTTIDIHPLCLDQ